MIVYTGRWNMKEGHQVQRNGLPMRPTLFWMQTDSKMVKFAWGYVGWRCYCLAFAILHDVLGEFPVYDLAKRFERHVISRLDQFEWTLTSDQVNEWLRVVRLDSELMAPEVRPQSK